MKTNPTKKSPFGDLGQKNKSQDDSVLAFLFTYLFYNPKPPFHEQTPQQTPSSSPKSADLYFSLSIY